VRRSALLLSVDSNRKSGDAAFRDPGILKKEKGVGIMGRKKKERDVVFSLRKKKKKRGEKKK